MTPDELILFQRCLSSKICIRIFRTLQEERVLNITAISRKAGCTNNRSLRHLRNLVRLGLVHEEFYAGHHSFKLKKTKLSELMGKAIKAMETRER